MIARAGISPTQTTFSTSEQMAFWSALAEFAPNRDIGVQLGANKTPEQLNLAELAAMHAPTFDECLKRLARYKRLVCAEEVVITRDGDDIRIGFHWIRASEPIPHLLIECVFAALAKLVQNASNERLVPRRIELSRRRLSRVEPRLLKDHFGCSIEFDAANDRMVLAASDLARQFRPQNAERYARLFPTLEAGIAKRALTFTDEVQRHAQADGRRTDHDRAYRA
ncbi:Transcriptional regulator, AraC family [Labilithrix luteola]|uniref:Transcriptional regulator, AraC family n=1 Tax=Labilithrix luteola TaxID=1391654 RepID=A0A0K1QET1_9BACT|nr:Transcriptional regulator, AraC family [Labilithrix luteola]